MCCCSPGKATLQQGLWEPHGNVPYMCTSVKTTGIILINITLRACKIKVFSLNIYCCTRGKKNIVEPLLPPKWPACPWLYREAFHRANTGSPPRIGFFHPFLSLWARAQGHQ